MLFVPPEKDPTALTKLAIWCRHEPPLVLWSLGRGILFRTMCKSSLLKILRAMEEFYTFMGTTTRISTTYSTNVQTSLTTHMGWPVNPFEKESERKFIPGIRSMKLAATS
jgi:hypothetical protein